MAALSIAYVGLPLGALALARAGFPPVAICLGYTDTPGARRVRRSLGARALVLGRPNLEDPGVQRALASVRADVLLSWFWPKRIPSAVLALGRRGAFGVHPSLLPRWRGPDPYFWAILSGEVETGVTLHALLPEYDAGAILSQRKLAIAADENAWALARRLDRLGLPLLVEAARRLSEGDAPSGRAQDPREVSEAPRPDDAQLAIDWAQPAVAIVRLVRAAAPYPGASASLGDRDIEVVRARVLDAPLPRALRPAEAVEVGGEVVVQSGRGGVVLERVRDEHGTLLAGGAIRALFPQGLTQLASASVRASGKNGG